MNLLPKDVLLMIAIENMDYNTIIQLCKSNSRYNTILCSNPFLWKRKLMRDYPTLNIDKVDNYKEVYIGLKSSEGKEYVVKSVTKILNPILGNSLPYGIILSNNIFKVVDIHGFVRSCSLYDKTMIIGMLRQLNIAYNPEDARSSLCNQLRDFLQSLGRLVHLPNH